MSPDIHGRKRALIIGGAGQDGWYLIELLLSHGYDVAVAVHSRQHVEPVVHSGRVTWHIGNFYWGSSARRHSGAPGSIGPFVVIDPCPVLIAIIPAPILQASVPT
jgi:uncharacterized protein YbjT (DUF2867 family)